jgi:glycosyltransferase involved in cell wall biosynthesis
LAQILDAEPGVVLEGFVQPSSIPARFSEAACLVLPSSFEPWAVVVHEAAAAGLLILASEAVGAVPHLVQNEYNGFIFGVNDAEELSLLMENVSRMDDAMLNAMAAASASLARQFTPLRWTNTLLDYVNFALQNSRSSIDLKECTLPVQRGQDVHEDRPTARSEPLDP